MQKAKKALLLIRDYFFQKTLYLVYKNLINSQAVFSNGYPIPKHSEFLANLECFDRQCDPQVLKNFFDRNGYLWIKDFYSKQEVYTLRDRCCSTLNLNQRSFILSPLYQYRIKKRLTILQKSPAYIDLTESKSIKELIEKVFGFEPQILARKLIRIKLPDSPISTGAHYDYNYVRQSNSPVYTVWIPLGDIPANGGAITYLANSKLITKEIEEEIVRKTKYLPTDKRLSAFQSIFERHGWITKRILSLAKAYQTQWLTGDFEAGDIIIHDPYIIHASFNNSHHYRQINISTDVRFQSMSGEPDYRWRKSWHPFDELKQ